LDALAGLGSAPGSIAAHSALIHNEDRTKYWKFAASFGENYYRAELAWAKKTIAMLEGAE
jgi:hypothetical protein